MKKEWVSITQPQEHQQRRLNNQCKHKGELLDNLNYIHHHKPVPLCLHQRVLENQIQCKLRQRQKTCDKDKQKTISLNNSRLLKNNKKQNRQQQLPLQLHHKNVSLPLEVSEMKQMEQKYSLHINHHKKEPDQVIHKEIQVQMKVKPVGILEILICMYKELV